MMSLLVPPALRPGATIAIVAPASPFPHKELFAGLAWLGQRYCLRMRSGALLRVGYLAGDDQRRAQELTWALTEPGIDAVLTARGGYGCMRVLEHVDLTRACESPRWLIGFSDVTALHVALAAAGVASIHAPNATGLSAASPRERGVLLQLLERPSAPLRWPPLRMMVAGRAAGPAFGGNLALLEAMAAAGRLRVPRGAVLFIEDVTERPYRIDRMLTALALGGHLSRVAAIVCGGFDQCHPGPDGVTVEEVLEGRLGRLGVPVALDAPFGHGAANLPFPLGGHAILEPDGSLFFAQAPG